MKTFFGFHRYNDIKDAKDGMLNFPIIADADKEIVTALGMLDPDEKGNDGTPRAGYKALFMKLIVLKTLL